eukprot:5185325-Amphidinium_carterae.1
MKLPQPHHGKIHEGSERITPKNTLTCENSRLGQTPNPPNFQEVSRLCKNSVENCTQIPGILGPEWSKVDKKTMNAE